MDAQELSNQPFKHSTEMYSPAQHHSTNHEYQPVLPTPNGLQYWAYGGFSGAPGVPVLPAPLESNDNVVADQLRPTEGRGY